MTKRSYFCAKIVIIISQLRKLLLLALKKNNVGFWFDRLNQNIGWKLNVTEMLGTGVQHSEIYPLPLKLSLQM